MKKSPAAESRPLSVSELTRDIGDLLAGRFSDVWVVGEITNLSQPRSGHAYFTLRDAESQLPAVVWRLTRQRLGFALEDGQRVICRGRIQVYGPAGKYQLAATWVAPEGEGPRQAALRQLRARLAAEGLFADERKRPLPRFPQIIAVVTSPTGAAIRDFLQVARRRYAGCRILIAATRVQGAGSAAEIVRAIERVNRIEPPVDVVVLARGGGGSEDLWAFNEEPVVRAAAASRAPLVSAVGHEIDVVLTDLVADVRALSPSEAAEMVLPDQTQWREALVAVQARLTRAARGQVESCRREVERLTERPALRRPLDRLHALGQRVDELGDRLVRGAQAALARRRQELIGRAAQLESLSPLRVLLRGYSLTTRSRDDRVVTQAEEVTPGELLRTRLARGAVVSRVERTEEPEHGGE